MRTTRVTITMMLTMMIMMILMIMMTMMITCVAKMRTTKATVMATAMATIVPECNLIINDQIKRICSANSKPSVLRMSNVNGCPVASSGVGFRAQFDDDDDF